MTDIAIVWDAATSLGDFAVQGGDLQVGEDLYTAVTISLFTDARAPDGLLPPGTDPRGWWGDTYEDSPLGSLLWTLPRQPISNRQQILRTAENYCENALQWMVTQGVAASVNSAASFVTPTALLLVITIVEPGATSPTVFQFSWAWAEIGPRGT